MRTVFIVFVVLSCLGYHLFGAYFSQNLPFIAHEIDQVVADGCCYAIKGLRPAAKLIERTTGRGERSLADGHGGTHTFCELIFVIKSGT